MGQRDPTQRYALLDRDGTIIVERHYLSDPEAVELLPGAAEGLRRLSALGLGLVVVTNQSAVARGILDLPRLREIHDRLAAALSAEGVRLDAIYFCPHHPDEGCACRKPRPGMALRAARELGFDPRAGFVIGDMASDVGLGRATGAKTLLVRTGYGARTEESGEARPDHVVDGLVEAARVIEHLL